MRHDYCLAIEQQNISWEIKRYTLLIPFLNCILGNKITGVETGAFKIKRLILVFILGLDIICRHYLYI